MRRINAAFAVAAVIALAGCGGKSAKSVSTTAGGVTVSVESVAAGAPTTKSATSTTKAATPAPVKTTAPAPAPASTSSTSGSTPPATSSSSTSTSTSTTAPAAKNQAAAPKQKTPIPCLVQAGLVRPGRSAQFGTWQGIDPVSHRPIYVDGPYKSVADANASAGTLQGVEQVQGAGLWVVSASLRGGTGQAVQHVAQCLRR